MMMTMITYNDDDDDANYDLVCEENPGSHPREDHDEQGEKLKVFFRKKVSLSSSYSTIAEFLVVQLHSP